MTTTQKDRCPHCGGTKDSRMPLSGAGARCIDKWHNEAPVNDLERLRGLSEKATAGEWTLELLDDYITGHIVSPLHDYCGNTVGRKDSITAPDSMTHGDGEFIVTCVNYVRSLLADSALGVGETGPNGDRDFEIGFRGGLKYGWNCGISEDLERYNQIMEGHPLPPIAALATAPANDPRVQCMKCGHIFVEDGRPCLKCGSKSIHYSVYREAPAPPVAEAGLRDAAERLLNEADINDSHGDAPSKFSRDIRLLATAALRAIPGKSEERWQCAQCANMNYGSDAKCVNCNAVRP